MSQPNSKKRSHLVYRIIIAFFLILFAVIVVFPFFWILCTSFKGTQAEIYAFPVKYWPDSPSWANYISILIKGNFGKYFLNSIFTSSFSALFAVTIGIMAGYVIARFSFRGRRAVLFLFLFTQMIPAFMLLAPQYQMMSKLHLINTRWVLILCYTNMMIPFSTVTLRGFFDGIPRELEEAAMVDGCGRIQSLFHIVLPVMLPGISSTFIFSFINSWNELFSAVMFIDVDKYRTIPVALNALILKYDIEWGEMSAGIVISIIPTMVLFAFSQKYIAEGLTAGAVKG